MINSVSVNPNSAYTQKAHRKGVMPDLSRKNLSFGYGQEQNSVFDNVKYGFATLTNDLMGLIGFNALLWWIQSKVNGDILVGKINKHYTDKIQDQHNLMPLAFEMKNKKKLDNVEIYTGNPGEAYYTHTGNRVVPPNSVLVGKDNFSSLFHELGHAHIENNTKVLKTLQRFRGHYTWLALGLYALMSQNRKQNYNPFGEPQEQTFGDKVKNFLSRSSLLVPLLAFSPELITEAAASRYGMKFLKQQVKDGKIPEAMKKNIGRSYLACFGTYLFIPVSIILMEVLQNSLEKEVNKLRRARNNSKIYNF